MEHEAYPFERIEKKWQAYWAANKTFAVAEDPAVPKEKRKYVLDMFPYPSAEGLHVGHPEGYTATDIYCRFLRMNGYAVLHPMGFDSFGLPAENYAIKTGTHPRATTERNIDKFREQIKRLGFSYDWDREVATHRSEYYRWTQWIFCTLYDMGLAYEQNIPVWYCPELGTVLANEEVLLTDKGPRSERGNHPVEKRPLRQWMLKITAYAERLLADLDGLDWPESIKTMQRNWIGKSEGASVVFYVDEVDAPKKNAAREAIEVFTTRPDTLFGVTYLAVSPEHPLRNSLVTAEHKHAVEAYVQESARKSDLERTDLAKTKTGVFTGSYAVNPVNGENVPVWVADYVLMGYGTGAVMAVPAHDARDFAFAKTFGLPVRRVIAAPGDEAAPADAEVSQAYTDARGSLVNSGQFSGLAPEDAKKRIVAFLESRGEARAQVHYKLRDWIFSRQRYWGEPIPVVHAADGTKHLLAETDLPLLLPEVESYKPTGTGESPLAAMTEWKTVLLPDGTTGERETNTMPQWAGSCWYYLRYLDPHNTTAFASREKIDYWMPVDLYVGGAEHAVLHLLYARFWHKVLFDAGLVNTSEPFIKLVNQGMILGEDGNKMSKSLGNVINPDDIVREYGADSLRLYEMFMGPLRQEKPWSTNGLAGIYRFLSRVWNARLKPLSDESPPPELLKALHKSIKKITKDTESLACNTAISQMMILLSEMQKHETLYRSVFEDFVRLLCPYAPHLAEELWEFLGHDAPASRAAWPAWDEALTVDDEVEAVFQVNGKVRAKRMAPRGLDAAQMEALAREDENIAAHLAGKTVRKVVVVPDKLVNFVCG